MFFNFFCCTHRARPKILLLDLDKTLIVSGPEKVNPKCTRTLSTTTVYPGVKSFVLYKQEMSAILQTAQRQGIRIGVITAGGAEKAAVLKLLQQEFGLSNLNDDHFIFYNKNNGVSTLDNQSKYEVINTIYKQYLATCFPSPKECIVFVDDTLKQCEAAQWAGYQAIQAKTSPYTFQRDTPNHHIVKLQQALGLPAASEPTVIEPPSSSPGIAI